MDRVKNAKKSTIDGVLFLQGVFKSDNDYIEDLFHDRLLHGADSDAKTHDKIPMVFTDLESWPKTTNLLCWNCRRSIKGRPWFEPQSIDPAPRGKMGEFVSAADLDRSGTKLESYYINVKGCFCSANCTMRHILIYAKDLGDRVNKIAMLRFVYEIFTTRKIIDIHPAPLVTDMVQYGGSYTEYEYQKKIDDSNAIVTNRATLMFVNNCKNFFSNIEPE